MNERNAAQQQVHDAKLDAQHVSSEKDVTIGVLHSDVDQTIAASDQDGSCQDGSDQSLEYHQQLN